MNNPINMIKSLLNKNSQPQDLIKNMTGNNPMLNNLVNMAQSGDSKGVETFARNLFKEKGRDFDKEFSQFMANFK